MTPEEFESVLRRSPSDKLVAVVNALDEAERKSLFNIVKAVRKDITAKTSAITGAITAGEWKKRQAAQQKWQSKNPFVESNIVLGTLACDAQDLPGHFVSFPKSRYFLRQPAP